jgi:hypothetical protein
MGRSDYEDSISESGNWNMRQSYSELLFNIIQEAYYHEKVAEFGVIDDPRAMMMGQAPQPREEVKIEGLRKFVFCIYQLIMKSKFAVTKNEDRLLLGKYEETINKMKPMIDSLYKSSYNNVTKIRKLTINEKAFSTFLQKCTELLSKIEEPLNRAELIFSPKDVHDPYAYKEHLKKRMLEKG